LDKIPEYFGNEAGKKEQPAPDRFPENLKQYDSHYLIATLADPVHTNLELYFDRGIEAIMRAAGESGYDFDRYWLPWSSEALPEEPNCYWRGLRDQTTEEKEQMPGLLLFRKPKPPEQPGKAANGKSEPPRLLFVFLVAETPTSGIEKDQFVNAVSYIQDIRSKVNASASEAIPVLGPTFSGSVDSLILAVNVARQRVGAPLRFRVSSGSITNSDAVDRLRTELGCDRNRPCTEAGTTVANDCAALTGFNGFLQSQGTQLGEVALISEDGTAYGEVSQPNHKGDQQSAAQCRPPEFLELHFPRKMASLRQAYQENPQVGAWGASQQVSLPRRLLPSSLTESAQSEEDAVPVFSKQQTPIAQESQMVALAATLREKDIKYAGIMATDPLDTMFLIRFLHRSAPDVRLFVVDADMFFLRALEDDTAPLGLLAITSYPLLTASQTWLPQHPGADKSHLMMFTSKYGEGTYNSCLLLLGEGRKVRDSYVATLDSRSQRTASAPQDAKGQASNLSVGPPLWLMMAGHSGYWPVRLLPGGILTVSLANEKLPRAWVFLLGLFTFLALCHAVAVIAAQFRNWSWLRDFKLAGERSPLQHAQKAFYLLVATLAALGIEGLLLYAPGRLGLLGPWLLGFASWVTALLVVVAAGLLVIEAAGLWRVITAWFLTRISPSPWWNFGRPFSSLREKEKKGLVNAAPLTLLALLALEVFVIAGFYFFRPWSWGGAEPYTSFFWYRSIHLTSGVSPVLPFYFLIGTLYAWAWTHLRCLATAGLQPRLWPSILLKPFVDADEELGRGMGEPLYNWKVTLGVFALTLLTFLVFDVRKHFATPESSPFSEVYIASLALLFLLLFSSWARLLFIWSQFRTVLEGFDQLPLRSALRRLPKQYSWSPIWEHGGTRQSYEILIRWFDNLQKLASVTGSKELWQSYYSNWAVVQEIAGQPGGSGKATPLIPKLQNGLRETTLFIEKTYLRPEWPKGKSDSLSKEAQSSLTEKSREREFWPNKIRILAEESLALYYVRYIRNVCLYMRYVLFFISAGFILALISLKSYPFQSEHALSWAVTAVFAALGIGVIKVFVEMEKDPVLSCLADTKEGKLSGGFYVRLLSYGALPLFTLIAAQFPSVARFFFSWIQPSLNTLK